MITAEQANKLSEAYHSDNEPLNEKRVKEIENDIERAARNGEYFVRYKTLSKAIIHYFESNGFIVVEQTNRPFSEKDTNTLGFNILWGQNVPDALTNSFYLQ